MENFKIDVFLEIIKKNDPDIFQKNLDRYFEIMPKVTLDDPIYIKKLSKHFFFYTDMEIITFIGLILYFYQPERILGLKKIRAKSRVGETLCEIFQVSPFKVKYYIEQAIIRFNANRRGYRNDILALYELNNKLLFDFTREMK